MRSYAFAFIALTSLLLASPLARAQSVAASPSPSSTPSSSPSPPADDSTTLHLVDGTTLFGRVLERRPDGSVLFELVTGERREIAASQMVVQGALSPQPTEPAPPPILVEPAPEEIATLQPMPGRVPLVFESTAESFQLGVQAGEETHWAYGRQVTVLFHRTLCWTPCTLYVHPGQFPAWLTGMRWQIDVPPGGERLRILPPHAGPIVGGVLMMVFGALGSIIGGGLLGFGSGMPSYGGSQRDTLMTAGGTALGIGLPVLIGGVVLFVIYHPRIVERTPFAPMRSARARVQWYPTMQTLTQGGATLGVALAF